MADEVQTRFDAARQVRRLSHTVNVHEVDVRVVPKEMVVKRRHVDPVVEQRRHHGIDLFLQQNKVAHHHVGTVGPFGHRDPPAETEGRGRRYALNRDFQVAARDIDLEYPCFEVALPVKSLQNFLIITRDVLSESAHAGQQETTTRKQDQHSFLHQAKHVMNLLVFETKNLKISVAAAPPTGDSRTRTMRHRPEIPASDTPRRLSRKLRSLQQWPA